MADKEPKSPSFEKSLARLEAIVADMESGKLGLEKMMESFEEGSKLAQLCAKKLNEVERKIEILVKKGSEIAPEPFELEANASEGKTE